MNLPTCAYQLDAFWGDLLLSFTNGARYNPRLLAADHGRLAYCTTTQMYVPTPSVTSTPTNEATSTATPSNTPAVEPPTPTAAISSPTAGSIQRATVTPTPSATLSPVAPTPSQATPASSEEGASIARIVPSVIEQDRTDVVLTVYGTHFTPDILVYWNTTPCLTTFVSNHEIRATVPRSQITAVGGVSIYIGRGGMAETTLAGYTVTVEPYRMLVPVAQR